MGELEAGLVGSIGSLDYTLSGMFPFQMVETDMSRSSDTRDALTRKIDLLRQVS